MNLHEKVLSSPEFAKWAKDKFVLVTLDYPSEKKQADAIKKQNTELKDKYKIQGYPTVIVINGDEKVLASSLGYGGEKPADWIASQEKEIAKGQGK
jgi:protein disulfide-isomerase